MRIDGWRVDGFGILRGHQVRGLADGLTVFLGPNEAGKSTLLAFLRGVLVGYPARGAAAHYPPLNGGEHGGRVFLRGAEGEVIVERMVKSKTPRVIFPDRVDTGDDVVRRLLGGVDAGLFNSVFAFSLTELQDLRSLSGEGVRDRIFSAGIAGAGRSARQAATRLDKEASELLRPRKGGRVNDLLDLLSESESLTAAARAAASHYPRLLEAEAEARRRVEAAHEEARAVRDALRRGERLLELWPVYLEGEEARRELESLGSVDGLPEDPEERLARVTGAVTTASLQVAELEADVDEARRAVDSGRAALRPDLAALSPRVEGVADRLGVYQDRVASLPEARAAAAQAAEVAARHLASLGRDWDEDRLRAFESSVPRSEEARERGVRLASSSAVLEGRRRDRDAAHLRLKEAEGERDRLRLRVAEADPAEEEGLRVHETALRRLRADAQEVQALEARIDGVRALTADRERSLGNAEMAVVGGGAGRVRGLLVLVALAALVGAVALWWIVDAGWGFALGVAALSLGAAAYFMGTQGPRAGRVQAEIAGLREGLRAARADLSALETQVGVVTDRMDADAVVVGLAARPTFAEIESRMEELDSARDRRRAREELRSRLNEAEEAAARAADVAAQSEAFLDEARAEQDRRLREWSDWKADVGVPADLGPEGVVEFLRAVRAAQEALEIRAEAAGRTDRLAAEIEAWETAARTVLADAGQGIEVTGSALVVELRSLREACLADRTQRERCVEAESALERIERKLAAAREALRLAQATRDTLFRDNGVEDEAGFRARVALLERRRRLEERVAAARRAVDTRLGTGADALELREHLALGRVDSWTVETEMLRQKSVYTEEEVTEAIRLHRDAERSRQALEESSDVAARELELGGHRAELETALRRWQVVTSARVLIEETLAEYSRTRQPPVLTEASAHLARVTGGAYTQILERDDAEGFVVLDSCGGMKAPEHLSRGTLEQLYLSLRLGLVAEFARRAGAVPVIMDDVVVNFDPVRARATAEVLASFAAEHQLLFFTCHPATAELLQKVESGVSVVDLGRG